MKSLALIVGLYLVSTTVVEVQGIFPILGLAVLKGIIIGSALNGGRNNHHHHSGNNGYRRSYYTRGYNRGYSRGSYYNNHHYHKRSIDEVNENGLEEATTKSTYQIPDQLILSADFQDINDCAKKFICELNAQDETKLDSVEMLTRSLFGYNDAGRLDVTKPSAHFDFAAIVGREAGLDQCKTIFARCDAPYEELKMMIEEGLVDETFGDSTNNYETTSEE